MCIEQTLIDISHESALNKGEKLSLRLIAKDVKKLKVENKRQKAIIRKLNKTFLD